jgi:hypothetical protein
MAIVLNVCRWRPSRCELHAVPGTGRPCRGWTCSGGSGWGCLCGGVAVLVSCTAGDLSRGSTGHRAGWVHASAVRPSAYKEYGHPCSHRTCRGRPCPRPAHGCRWWPPLLSSLLSATPPRHTVWDMPLSRVVLASGRPIELSELRMASTYSDVKKTPGAMRSGSFSRSERWAGAGSNRRPSAFQAWQSPCSAAGSCEWRGADGALRVAAVVDVAVSAAVIHAIETDCRRQCWMMYQRTSSTNAMKAASTRTMAAAIGP